MPVLFSGSRPFVLLVLLFLFILTGCSHSVKFTEQKKSGPVVVLGDSLSEGFSIPKEETYVAVLRERLGVEIVNLGKKGITTGESLPRVKEEVLPLEPGLVILQLGGNDALQKKELSETRANLQTMIDQIHEQKIPILLLGVRGGLLKDKYANMYEELVEKNGLAYVPDILDGILTSPGLRVDNIHPNGKGHQMIADRVEPELVALLKKLGIKS